jgi:hypothetical protein
VARPGDLLLERLDQRPAPAGEQLDRAQVVDEGRLRAAILELARAQPAHVPDGPGPAPPRVALTAAQQELPEPVAGAHQVAAHVLNRAHEVAEVLVLDARHEREPKLAGGQQPDQPGGVAAVGLDPVARTLGDRPRRRHSNVDLALARRPGQAEAGRACLIDRAHPGPEALQERGHLERRHPQLADTQFSCRRIEHGSVRLPRVHVQTDEGHTLRHGRLLLCGLWAPRGGNPCGYRNSPRSCGGPAVSTNPAGCQPP